MRSLCAEQDELRRIEKMKRKTEYYYNNNVMSYNKKKLRNKIASAIEDEEKWGIQGEMKRNVIRQNCSLLYSY